MDVVGDSEPVTVGAGGVDTSLEVVLGSLDLDGSELVIIIRIEIE